jgi:hypothetical protein
MQRILAICWLTWKAALRFRLFLVIAALLIVAVVGLPLVIKDDGTAQGFTQIILTYTLSAITALLGFSTIWLSCGTLARDIEECQIQVLATKPIARWQIWLGKWLGIAMLNAALLALSGVCVYGLLMWRAAKLPPKVQQVLREEILVSRGSAKPSTRASDIEDLTDQTLKKNLKNHPVENPKDVEEMRRQIREQVKATLQVIPPGYEKVWKIDLSQVQDSLQNQPLRLRIKFNTPIVGATTTFKVAWMIGQDEKPGWTSDLMDLSADTFHEFSIPANLFDSKGILRITAANPNETALLFPLTDGMEVLYPEGGFGMNFARALGIIFCWLALMSAMGLMSASFLTFPVAAFFSMALMVVVLSSGTIAESVSNNTIASGNEETGVMGHASLDVVLIPLFKGLLVVTGLVKNFSPVDALSSGRTITWGQLGLAFGQIVLLVGGFFVIIGMVLFHRRELATAQGNQ